MRTLAIIPTYNEAENIERLVREVTAIGGVDVLVVDDNSPDGTGRIADGLSRENPSVKVIHRKGKLGLGTAYILGFGYAVEKGYGRVVQMDCDFSHDPKYIPLFLDVMEREGLDLVIGSRYVKGGRIVGWSLSRHVLSRGGNLYARLVLGRAIRDWTTGFKVFKTSVLRRIIATNSFAEGYAFLAEMTYRALRAGCRVKEVPIVFKDRVAGESKMGSNIISEAAYRVWKLRRER